MNLLQTSQSNNAIVVELANVRPHPNADRLKVATVLGTQVVVGLDAKDGDVMVYFDSNLCLSHEYLRANNLYSNPDMNLDTSKKGYFGSNGRVKSQRFRGEVSNGYVASLSSIIRIGPVREGLHWNYDMIPEDILHVGDEFTHVGGVPICMKYTPDVNPRCGSTSTGKKNKRVKRNRVNSDMFWKHWDTKHLMRENHRIPQGEYLYVEEKIHGTSGRTGKVLCTIDRPWWKFWIPKQQWRVVSGTRRTDHINAHMSAERREVHEKLAPHLRKGEEVYYEIYGYSKGGKPVQKRFSYGCKPDQYKVMLYRVTLTTPDGFSVDLPRRQVYQRAKELGLECPVVLFDGCFDPIDQHHRWEDLLDLAKGKSQLDAGTLREGIVVWFTDAYGQWGCLKHKSEEFLMQESKDRDSGVDDVEDLL